MHPGAQRNGYGRAMMGACEQWLAARHIPKVNLMVRDGNAEAKGLYTAIGYNHDDVVVLSRRLAE